MGNAAPSRRSYVNLADGRRLTYAEGGDPAGRPVIEFRGFPSSRNGDAIDVPALAPKGVCRITVDRPGVGFSDPQPGRVLLDWPDDVRVLADTLGLQSFAGAGHVRRWALRRGIRLCPGRADCPRRAVGQRDDGQPPVALSINPDTPFRFGNARW